MNEIIKLTNGQPVVDSLTIADGAQIEHASVMKLTRKYEDDFNSFGRVGFERIPRAFPIHVAHMGGVKRG